MRARLQTAVPILVLLCGATACDVDKAFLIYQNQVPQTGCKVTPQEDVYRPEGILDVSLGKGYTMFPLLINDFPARQQTQAETTDPHTLHLREYEVRIDLGDAVDQTFAAGLTQFTRLTSGVMNPGDRRASFVQVIPDELAKQIKIPAGAQPQIIIEVRAVADSSDGRVDSLPFLYPLRLCDGCLVTTLPECPTDANVFSSSNVCGLPQDGPLLCCKDPALGTICPAGSGA